LTGQSVIPDWQVSVLLQACPGSAAVEEGQHFVTRQLSTISKILERLVLTRLRLHLFSYANSGQYQSAYRAGHSTETALLKVLDGIYTAADDKRISMLIGLDLLAAFDTVDHSLLIERLQFELRVTDISLE